MYFRILHDESSGVLSYLLADTDAAEAVLVDPRGGDLTLLLSLLAESGLRIRWVLRTHQHDAMMPNELELLAHLDAPIVQGEPTLDTCPAVNGERLAFGNQVITVHTTPGHTLHCLSYSWLDRLFCGGLLYGETCPHQPQPASPEALWDSVRQQVFTLPDETLLFAGHTHRAHAFTTVMEQRRWHPLFSSLSRDEFLARVTTTAPCN